MSFQLCRQGERRTGERKEEGRKLSFYLCSSITTPNLNKKEHLQRMWIKHFLCMISFLFFHGTCHNCNAVINCIIPGDPSTALQVYWAGPSCLFASKFPVTGHFLVHDRLAILFTKWIDEEIWFSQHLHLKCESPTSILTTHPQFKNPFARSHCILSFILKFMGTLALVIRIMLMLSQCLLNEQTSKHSPDTIVLPNL